MEENIKNDSIIEKNECLDCSKNNESILFLKKQIENLNIENANLQKQALYIKSDIENIRRNTIKDINDSLNKASIKIITQFILVLDDFERCIKNEKSEGLEIIYKSFLKTFDALEVKEIEVIGKFDPEKHEAISTIQATKENESGSVVSVSRKGYFYKNILIRPTLVIVAE